MTERFSSADIRPWSRRIRGASSRSGPTSQEVELFGRRLNLQVVRLVDQRADDERLATLSRFLTNALIDDLLALGRFNDLGPHSFSVRRQFVDHGVVQLAVDRQRQRARDRRGGHDEQVRAASLAAQGVALENPEAVLLVDDGQAEVVEVGAFLDQRVRTDHEIEHA